MWMRNLGVTALAVLAGAAVLVSCRRDFDSPYMPGSPGYAGDEWTRDADGDGVADSLDRYSPACQATPKDCLEKAKDISRISSQRNTLIARDVLLWAGDSPQAPNLEWTPVEGALRGYVLNSSDSAKVRIRDGRLLPVAAGSAQISVTVPGADSLYASFIAKVVSGGTRLESVSAKDIAVSVGRDTAADVEWTPADADFRDYFLVSDLPLVARIVDGRTIRGVYPGKANITLVAMDGSRKTAFSVTVSSGPEVVYASALAVETMYLIKGGGEETPKLHWLPSNVTDKNYKLVTMDSRYVTVTGDSLRVIPLEAGTATVLVKALDGSGKAAGFTVVVAEKAVPVPVAVIPVTLIDADSMTLTVGQEMPPKVTWSPAGATNKAFTLSTQDTGAVDIINSTIVYAKRMGRARVTVKSADGPTGTFQVVVNAAAVRLASMSAADFTMNVSDIPRDADIGFFPSNAGNKSVTLASPSGASVISINAQNKVVAEAPGKALLTAVSNENSAITASCTVTVVALVKSLTAKDITLKAGPLIHNTDSLMTFQPATASDKNWFLTYADVAASPAPYTIVMIHNGRQLEAIAPGTARIIAVSNGNPAAKDTFTVTVTGQVPLEGIQGANLRINLLLDGDISPEITFTPSDAGNKGYTLTSLNTDVVTIVNGKLRPINRGSAEVAVTSLENGDIKDTFEVSVDFFGF